MKKNRKLSGYLVDPDFQGKFLITFGSFGLMQSFLFYYSMGAIFEQVNYILRSPQQSRTLLFEQLDGLQNNMYMLFGGSFVIFMVLFIVVAFRFTHKTAGALFQFRKTFDEITESGDLKPVKLRDGDFFKEVETSFNKMVDQLKK